MGKVRFLLMYSVMEVSLWSSGFEVAIHVHKPRSQSHTEGLTIITVPEDKFRTGRKKRGSTGVCTGVRGSAGGRVGRYRLSLARLGVPLGVLPSFRFQLRKGQFGVFARLWHGCRSHPRSRYLSKSASVTSSGGTSL